MISFETPTEESLSELRANLNAGISIFWDNHDAETVAKHLINTLGPDWNQTGIAGNADFLWGKYWRAIDAKLQKEPWLSAPDWVSVIYTNEFILAEELGNAGYTASEAAAVILEMREKESMRQDILHRAAQIVDVTSHPAHPDEATSTAARVLAAHE